MSDLLTVRYPSGETEYRMSNDLPNVGDILSRNGDNWEVQHVTKGADGSPVVTLRPLPHPPKPETA